MSDEDPLREVNPWVPMSRPRDIKIAGKLIEELGEGSSAIARCLIQGIDACEPVTGKPNRQWLEEEIADIVANVELVVEHFELDPIAIRARVARKKPQLSRWHAMAPL